MSLGLIVFLGIGWLVIGAAAWLAFVKRGYGFEVRQISASQTASGGLGMHHQARSLYDRRLMPRVGSIDRRRPLVA